MSIYIYTKERRTRRREQSVCERECVCVCVCVWMCLCVYVTDGERERETYIFNGMQSADPHSCGDEPASSHNNIRRAQSRLGFAHNKSRGIHSRSHISVASQCDERTLRRQCKQNTPTKKKRKSLFFFFGLSFRTMNTFSTHPIHSWLSFPSFLPSFLPSFSP